MKKVTARDVARRAGVSQPTVSLVLTGNPRARIADDTRRRVLRAAADLDYRPNILARGLVLQRSYAIAVLIPNLANPFFTEVVRGVERVAAEQGYAVLLCDTSETAAEKHIAALRSRVVDGVIMDALGVAALPEGALNGMNVVLVDEPSEQWPSVVSDARGAGRAAAEHLLGLGHRQVAFAGPATDVFPLRMRERGFFEALRGAGVAPVSSWLQRVPANVTGGMAAMRSMLARAPRPTAIFCANDLLALGALKAALTAGLRVPESLSIVGCDDIELARVVTPELTTVSIPARELGARAARLLLRRLEGAEQDTRPARPLPVRLVVRETTAPPAGGERSTE